MQFDNPSMIDTLSPDAGPQAQRRQLLALLISAPWLPSLAQAAENAAAAGGEKAWNVGCQVIR